MSTAELKAAYIVSGDDRPKVERALGRLRARFDPATIERSVTAPPDELVANADAYIAAGATHLITRAYAPDFDLDSLRRLVAWRDARRA